MLQTYYLGGLHESQDTSAGSQPGDAESVWQRRAPAKRGLEHSDAPKQVHCPACRTSRLARYPKTMYLKSSRSPTTSAPGLEEPFGCQKRRGAPHCFVLLRQLHYLIGVFQHVEHAELRVDELLVAFHDHHDGNRTNVLSAALALQPR
ncbi:hypothetical protein PINS_up022833 [Pythium insidiosum]|nr:hypothetical protein PINS_up022833 [Pythium insidiosum]